MSLSSAFFALGLRRSKDNTVLDVYFPSIQTDTDRIHHYLQHLNFDGAASFIVLSDDQKDALASVDESPLIQSLLLSQTSSGYSRTDLVAFFMSDGSQPVQSAEEGYFKLQCISQRLAKPHSLSLDGMFGKLTNLAWTNKGPILPDHLDAERVRYFGSDQPLVVSHIDKFPYLADYHYPSGVRIASGSQVRLGAYLGEGTTIMPAGYVNFNAGTEGNAMIEGRVSAGVVVGNNSDVGGGASIMGTLSGGNKDVISIGEQCLLGANAGTGISLGKGCTIAAGLYVYAGMKVALVNDKNEPLNLDGAVVAAGDNIVKAKELSGRDYLLFIQDSQSGQLICKPNQNLIELNEQLHHND